MRLFQWLLNLFNQLIDWLRKSEKLEKNREKFIEELMCLLQELWETVVVISLVAAFGFVAILYVIFYAGEALGETIMEVWDPNYYDSKPSQVFKLKQAPHDSPLPKRRSEAKVLTLEDWH